MAKQLKLITTKTLNKNKAYNDLNKNNSTQN